MGYRDDFASREGFEEVKRAGSALVSDTSINSHFDKLVDALMKKSGEVIKDAPDVVIHVLLAELEANKIRMNGDLPPLNKGMLMVRGGVGHDILEVLSGAGEQLAQQSIVNGRLDYSKICVFAMLQKKSKALSISKKDNPDIKSASAFDKMSEEELQKIAEKTIDTLYISGMSIDGRCVNAIFEVQEDRLKLEVMQPHTPEGKNIADHTLMAVFWQSYAKEIMTKGGIDMGELLRRFGNMGK